MQTLEHLARVGSVGLCRQRADHSPEHLHHPLAGCFRFAATAYRATGERARIARRGLAIQQFIGTRAADIRRSLPDRRELSAFQTARAVTGPPYSLAKSPYADIFCRYNDYIADSLQGRSLLDRLCEVSTNSLLQCRRNIRRQRVGPLKRRRLDQPHQVHQHALFVRF
jgi:hypothetical protein